MTLCEWLGTPAGRTLLDYERGVVGAIVDGVFGHQGLEVSSCCPPADFISNSAVVGRFRTSLTDQGWLGGDLVARLPEMPLQDDSLRLLLLHHVLEQAQDRDAVYSEIERVLAPEGVLVLVGFSRFSLWGLSRGIGRATAPPAQYGYLDISQVARRLRRLGVDPLVERYLGHGLPGSLSRRRPKQGDSTELQRRGLDRIGARLWKRYGGVCVLVARKHREGMTPLRLKRVRIAQGLPAAANGAGAWCQQTGEGREKILPMKGVQ